MKQKTHPLAQELEPDLCNLVGKYYSQDIFAPAWADQVRRDSEHYELIFYDLPMFVGSALANVGTPITPSKRQVGCERYHLNLLAECFYFEMRSFVELVKMLPDAYEYHEYVTTFRNCCVSMGLLDDNFYWGDLSNERMPLLKNKETDRTVELFNRLVKNLQDECQRSGARAAYLERKRGMDARLKSCSRYADSLFEACSRLVVLRIDLGYLNEIAASITLEQAKKDINRLYANKRFNRLFRNMIGYIIKTEYGISKKIHFHTLLFFDGAKRDGRKHSHLAMTIGEYWVKTITNGCGMYWNCNDRINSFIKLNRCGIGVIKRDDLKLRENLVSHVIRYLCKSEQFIRPRFGQNYRLLQKGESPKPARGMGKDH